MRRAGHRGECRGRADQLGAGLAQPRVQLRKAQIVTDAQAQPADRRIRHHHLLTVPVVIGLPIAAAVVAHVDVEQVQLVVTRRTLAVLVDQQRAGVGLSLRLIVGRQRYGARHYP